MWSTVKICANKRCALTARERRGVSDRPAPAAATPRAPLHHAQHISPRPRRAPPTAERPANPTRELTASLKRFSLAFLIATPPPPRVSHSVPTHTHKRHLPSLLSLFPRERKRETNPPHPQKHTTHKQNDDLSFPAPEGFPALSPPTHTHTHRQNTHHTPHTARRRSRSPPRALFNLHITLCRENRSPPCPKHRSSAARMRQRGSLYLV